MKRLLINLAKVLLVVTLIIISHFPAAKAAKWFAETGHRDNVERVVRVYGSGPTRPGDDLGNIICAGGIYLITLTWLTMVSAALILNPKGVWNAYRTQKGWR